MPIMQIPSIGQTTWMLTECRQDDSVSHVHMISAAEASVGRVPPATIVVESPEVSKSHALLSNRPQGLHVRDLGSTNGTYVNGTRIQERLCIEGDLIQFAKAVFRVNRHEDPNCGRTIEGSALPHAEALLQFDALMHGRGLKPAFQPIIDLQANALVAYELLARSEHEHLRNPAAMFGFAALLGQEDRLSELMRTEGARIVHENQTCPNLFVNTHPKEVINSRFLDSLTALRSRYPSMMITVEIHEAAITSVTAMSNFREFLRRNSMLLAYDDFGSGQARLDELSQIPPDYLKFDIKLMRDIDTAAPGRKAMIRFLVNMAKELKIHPLAEGIETAGEAQACIELGFEHAQGYYFGRPAPLPTKPLS